MNTALRRLLTTALILFGIVSAYLATKGIFAAGVSWDSGIDTDAAGEIRRLTDDMSLQQAYDAVYYTSEYYGIFIQGAADWLHHLVTGSTEFMPAYELATYRWQAGVNVVVATLGAAGLGVGVWRTLRSGLAGAFAWALLMTIPLYAGMSHVDLKDMPVAAGLTMISAGFMMSISRYRSRGDVATSFVFAALGGIIAFGTRINGWPLLFVIGGSACIAGLLRFAPRRDWLHVAWPFGVGVVTAVATLVSLWFTNPLARIGLFPWLWDSAMTARATAGYDGPVRTLGQDLPSRALPWWYIPSWVGAQLPLLTTLLVVAGLVVMIWVAWKPSKELTRGDLLAYVPLLGQGLVIPALLVVMHSTLYGGIRHVLFVIPALAGIAAFAIPALEAKARDARRWLVVLAGAVVLPPLFGLLAIVQWFPYGYAYINPVAAMHFPTRDWDLDGWGVTAIEGVQRLQEMGQTKIAAYPTDFTSKMIGAATPEAINDEHVREFGFYQFIVGDQKPLPPGCTRAFTIERAGLLLGEGAVCHR